MHVSDQHTMESEKAQLFQQQGIIDTKTTWVFARRMQVKGSFRGVQIRPVLDKLRLVLVVRSFTSTLGALKQVLPEIPNLDKPVM